MLRFDGLLIGGGSVEARISAAFDHARAAMIARSARDWLVSVFGASLGGQLSDAVVAIDHVGFLVRAGTTLAQLNAAASLAGFCRPEVFPSTVIARELGARLGTDAVP